MLVGSSQTVITPKPEVSLLGYDFRQQQLTPGHSGVRDDLWVRALAIDAEDGAGPALIISLDLCIISIPLARRLRALVSEHLGIPADRCLLSCSHTHSGPWLDEAALAEELQPIMPHINGSNPDQARQAYTATLAQAVVTTASKARGLVVPVMVSVYQAPLGLGYNRRVPDGHGGVQQCWNPEEYPRLQPNGPTDPSLSAVVFRQLGGHRQWVLWSHGTHPVVLGKTSTVVSADWPGAANAYLAERGISGHFVLGACGDVHPWIATQDDPHGVAVVGEAAGTMLHLLSRSGGTPQAHAGLQIATHSVPLGGREVDLAVWHLAGLTIAASPTELFAELALDLRQRCPGPLMVATNCNGWSGYWPTRHAFNEGGYEIKAAHAMGRQAGDSEALVDHLAAMIERVQAG